MSTSSYGFLSNKRAVAGAFTAIGLVALGVVMAIVIFWRKKVKHRHVHNDDDFFTNLVTEPQMAESATGNNPSALETPRHSATELTAYAPMDIDAINKTYFTPNSSFIDMSSTRPGPTWEQGSLLNNHLSQSHISSPPSSAVTPVRGRKAVVRGSYQPSLDSFYGAV